MAADLLRKEEEYRKVNEQLEEKSKYLFQEVDTVRVSTISFALFIKRFC